MGTKVSGTDVIGQGRIIEIDEKRIHEHLGEMVRGTVEDIVRVFPNSVTLQRISFWTETYEENPTPSECE